MTEQQFDERVKEIELEFNTRREGADAYRDQELAWLFVRAKAEGQGQEWIARRMGWTQQRVSQRLLLGRFLIYNHGCTTASPHDLFPQLTERRFRGHWAASKLHKKDTEEERFARVAKALRTDTQLPKGYVNIIHKPGIRPAVVALLSDGKRRTPAQIADALTETMGEEVSGKQVSEAVRLLKKKAPAGMAFEERHHGNTHRYRLVPRRGPAPVRIDPDRAGAFAAEALPLVEECIDTLKKPELHREITLALEHLSRVQQWLKALLVPEEVA